MFQLGEIAQHLLRFSPDALVVADEQGRIRFANDTVIELFGYQPAELLGQPIDMLVPERLRSRHGQHMVGYFKDPRSREMGARIADLFARRADGSEFPAGIRLAPFRYGEERLVAAAIRDMTERRRISDALVAAREEADRANRAKSRFLATASHDLRQPLQAIGLFNASMLKLSPSRDMHELLVRQQQAIDGMTRLLNALLDISRLESGAVEPQLVPVALADVFEELRGEFESLARSRGLAFEVAATDIVVSTDRILFYQMLQNLLGNALKYTDQGAVSVKCALEDESLTVEIADTGVGIPEDKVERIFDEYYQVDIHGARRMGVGLGLAIVKEVARLLGYAIQVSSRVGVGTQVRVRIPRQVLVWTAPPAGATTRAAPELEAPYKPRLILVEDNETVRIATELFLKLEGYETVGAGSFADAERLIGSVGSRDVLIVDYHLDGQKTGLEIVRRVREQAGSDVPAIVLSGDLPSVLRTVKTPPPACRLLGKPVDTHALVDAINELSRG